jgi:hypothetical protein
MVIGNSEAAQASRVTTIVRQTFVRSARGSAQFDAWQDSKQNAHSATRASRSTGPGQQGWVRRLAQDPSHLDYTPKPGRKRRSLQGSLRLARGLQSLP